MVVKANTKKKKPEVHLQSSLEGITVYAAAIIVIAIIVIVLFQLGIFSTGSLAPKAAPGSCQVIKNPLGAGPSKSLQGECLGQTPQFIPYLTGGYYTIPNPKPFGNVYNYTISLWFYMTPVDLSGNRSIISKVGTTPGSHATPFSIFLTHSNQGLPDMGFTTGSVNGCEERGYFYLNQSDENTWQNLVLEVNATPNLHDFTYQVYLNNNQVYNLTEPAPFGNHTSSFSQNLNTTSIYLGSTPTNTILCDPSNMTSFFGYMANVQLYNSTLNPSDVASIYQGGIGGAPSNLQSLVGWWPLNGNANDYSSYKTTGNEMFPSLISYQDSYPAGPNGPTNNT